MPLANDLNRDNNLTVNPYHDKDKHVNQYTAVEIATLQSRLDKQLGPEYISTRPGNGGGKVHYLAAEKVINLANEVFGFNGWSSAIQQIQIDFCDENRESGKISLGLSIIVRVTLKDGTYHEDIGYGHIENCKGKAAAFEKAKKEAATDALKRALRNFGNVLGNCLYDKDYLAKVTKIKIAPSKWDAENLHRHPDFAPIKKESLEEGNMPARTMSRLRSDRSARTNGSTEYGGDEFGGDLFEDDFQHPDEVMLDATGVESGSSEHDDLRRTGQTPKRPMERVQSMPNIQGQQNRRGGNGMPPPPQLDGEGRAPPQIAQPRASTNGQRPDQNFTRPREAGMTNARVQDRAASPNVGEKKDDVLVPDLPAGKFVSMAALAKGAVEDFDPLKETPSIRRTAGINTGKTEKIFRAVLNGEGQAPPPQPQAPSNPALTGHIPPAAAPRTNFVNPSADMHRRVGMPAAPQSPMSNRGAYKPPSAVKRPAPSDAPARPPLADTTNLQPPADDGGGATKKPKIEPVAPGRTENVAGA